MRLALAQIDTVVGDLDGNARRIRARMDEAASAGADLVLFPELALTGYPPEDLLLRPGFVRAAELALAGLARESGDTVALVGAPSVDGGLRNSCHVLARGEHVGVYHKQLLPNYGVFDEQRYFTAGTELLLMRFGALLAGATICEDIWWPGPPAVELARAGARLIVNVSASPFHVGKGSEREEIVRARALESGCAVALCNAVGGQDELVFDGGSIVCDAAGRVIARAPSFEEALLVVDLDVAAADGPQPGSGQPELVLGAPRTQRDPLRPVPAPELDELEQMRRALELGLRDYVEKNGFAEVVVGISGGVDSALTAALCVNALGAGRVHGVSMPSRYSSSATRGDAEALGASLGIDFREIPIEPTVAALGEAVAPSFAGRKPDLTEENLQARVRGTLLMALSNKFGWLVIATGNKSELSVGYSTLYGDLAGGFALLKDVYKTDVFRLARLMNADAGRPLIPESIIERAPSAELRADQRDEDTLPPYADLDRVLKAYVEEDRTREELSGDGFDAALVERAVALIDRAEYKRRQAPPGVKIHPKAFGRDRRTPITNRWPG